MDDVLTNQCPITTGIKQNLVFGSEAFTQFWATVLKDTETLKVVSEDLEYMGRCQNKRLRALNMFLNTEVQELKKIKG